jgi:hypothetical protein
MPEEPQDAPNSFLDALHRTESVGATLMGLDDASANSVATEAGMTTRVEQRNGKRLSLRADLRPTRINLTVESGTVVATRVG